MEATQERLVRYLKDAWAVEKSVVTAMKDMAEEVDDPRVRSHFEEHRQVTHRQEEELEARIRDLGEEPLGGKGLLNQIVAKIGDALHAAHDVQDKTTQDLMKSYATEHFEIAMYTALESYSRAVGDSQTAELAHRHMQEERQAADRVWLLIAPTAEMPARGQISVGDGGRGTLHDSDAAELGPVVVNPASQGIGSDAFVGGAAPNLTQKGIVTGSEETLSRSNRGSIENDRVPAASAGPQGPQSVDEPGRLPGSGATQGGWGGMGAQAVTEADDTITGSQESPGVPADAARSHG
jgi:ferritin-like metal-binding protein YciE